MGNFVKSRIAAHLFILIIACLSVYANTLSNDFVWEDLWLVSGNYHIRDYKNIPLFFTVDHWREGRSSTPDTGFRPLRETSFALDYRVWGLNPGGFHLTNLLLHIINVILAYYLSSALMAAAADNGRPDIAGRYRFFTNPAFLTALLFALHPIHTESVSYIKNRSDLLAFVFFQCACLLFIRRHTRMKKKERLLYYPAALVCFMLALWSKSMAISLPLVLFLYNFCFRREAPLSRRVVDTLPFFALALVYLWLEKSFLVAADAAKIGFDPASWRHIWTIVKTLGWYLKMLVWPVPLNIYHVFYPPASFLDPIVMLSLAALLVMAVVLVKTAFIDRLFFFGLSWILITLLPVANILVLFDRPIAEQRLYIPSYGFCLILSLAVSRVRHKPGKSWPLYIVIGIICAFYAGITVQRNFDWRDSVSLFSSTVKCSPRLAWAHNNLAMALKEQGRLDEAVVHYRAALAIKPQQAVTYNNIGAVLGEKGEFDKAVSFFATALQIQPQFILARDNMGLALTRLGRLDEAVHHFRNAIDQEPGKARLYAHLAAALEAKGEPASAIESYERALALDPDDAAAHTRLATLLLEKEDKTGACRHFTRAWRIDPVAFPLPPDCSRASSASPVAPESPFRSPSRNPRIK